MDENKKDLTAVEQENMEKIGGGNINKDYQQILKGFCPFCGKENTLDKQNGGWHCTFCGHNFWV